MDLTNSYVRDQGHINSRSLNIFGKTEDYVPLFTMYRPPIASINWSRTSWIVAKSHITETEGDVNSRDQANISLHERSKVMYNSSNKVEKIIGTTLNYLIPSRDTPDLINYVSKPYLDRLVKLKKQLEEGIYKSSWTYKIKKPNYSNNSYSDFFQACTTQNRWSCSHVRSGSYIGNFWYLANYNNSVNNWRNREVDLPSKGLSTLCCMMVKSEMLPYVRLCSLLNEPPHPDALELWVREGFDVPKGDFRQIRPHYRKHIRKAAIAEGIKIVTVPNIDEIMYYKHKPVKVKSISDRKKNVELISDEFIESRGIEIFASNSNIKLSLSNYE